MAYYIIKDDYEAGIPTRPYMRSGLPSTVRVYGGKGYVMLSADWMSYLRKINDTLARKYMFKDYPLCKSLKKAVGWHNTGKGNRVEQLTFSGNIVDVRSIEGKKAYIRFFDNNQKPPSKVIKPMPDDLNPFVHLFSVQYKKKLDMTTDQKYPRIFLIGNNEKEKLWIYLDDLKPYVTNNDSLDLSDYFPDL